MKSLEKLLDIMEVLRSSKGCPWDREQTHKSLRRYVIEEAFEVVEAVDCGNPKALADELGDLLLQIVFHAQIGKENGTFQMEDVIEAIIAKLIRRHPHVFADTEVNSVSEVLRNWEAIKATEREEELPASILDGISKSLPSLMWAEKVQKKAATVGFQWEDVNGAMDKFHEEFGEFEQAITENNVEKISEELGDVLFCLVNIARYLKTDPELSLRQTTKKFINRFHYIEEQAKKKQVSLEEMSLEEMDKLWDEAKVHFRKNPQ